MLKVGELDYPTRLNRLHNPPKVLYTSGAEICAALSQPTIAVVGSRSISPKGREITEQIASELASRGITIISGLAMGVDATAQQAALDAGGKVIAVLPSPLDNVVPRMNRELAKGIVDSGGVLVSEYPMGEAPYRQNFIARNRIVTGLADALLITEAAEKSGSLHTARFALEIGQDVMAVPGSVFDIGYEGCNNLIKRGAHLVTDYRDVLNVLGIDYELASRTLIGRNDNEQLILDLISQGVSSGIDLLDRSKLDSADFANALTMLELSSKIRPLGANNWGLG